MKINKYILGLAVVVLGGFTSCNTDVEGEYYKTGLDNVSFDVASQSLSVTVDESTVTIPVKVTRGNVASAYTAKYTAQATAEGIFSDDCNGTINFEAGQGTAVINVKAANLEKEVAYTYTLTLSDADVATADTITNTQIAKTTITVQREGDWTEWKKWNSAGTGKFIYGGHFSGFSGEDPGLPFTYRQSITNPNKYQLKIQHWGADVDLVMDYDSSTGVVKVASESFTGASSSTYGDIYVMDYNDWLVKYGGGSASANFNGSFDTEKGIIRIATIYIDYVDPTDPWGAGWESFYLDGFVRADYSISALTYAGIFTDAQQNVFAVGTLELAADANNVKAVVISADADADAVADAIAAGELDATDVEAGNINVPIADGLTGKLQIVAVSLDADGAVASTASAVFEYFGGGANPWKSLGKGFLLDNFVVTEFGPDDYTPYDPQTYEVEILENSDEPGMYRIVNAFEGAAAYAGYSEYYTPTNIEVNASDADAVYIDAQQIGLGSYAIATYGGYMLQRYDFETLKSYGYFGTLKSGVITFPSFELKDEDGNVRFTYQGLFLTADSKYYTGVDATADTQFTIVLPSAASSVKAKAIKRAKAANFASRLKGHLVKGQKVNSLQKTEKMKLLSKKVKKQKIQKGFKL